MVTDDHQESQRSQQPHPALPRQDRRSRTRDALLDAAQRLWAERGIRGASLDDIAGAANLTKGAVYSNFTGKTDLLLALLDRHTSTDFGFCLAPEFRDATRPPDERRHEAGHAYADKLGTGAERSEEPRLLVMLLMEFWLYGMRDFAVGWRIANWYEARRNELTERIADLAGGADDAGTDGISAAERATLAMAMEFGLALQHLLDPERVPAQTYAGGLRLILGPAFP